jgi:hypothetical protein
MAAAGIAQPAIVPAGPPLAAWTADAQKTVVLIGSNVRALLAGDQ